MSEEALRRARNAKVYHVMLPDNGFTEPCAVVKVSDVQEALSEGQAPEPVAQEPDREELLGDAIRGLIAGKIKCSDDLPAEQRPVSPSARKAFGCVYTLINRHPAGMDAARAKAIEAAAQAVLREMRIVCASGDYIESRGPAAVVESLRQSLATKGAGS